MIVILIPVAFYGGIANDVVETVAGMEVVDAKTQETLQIVSDDYLTPIADGTTVSVFRALGGDILIDEMTSFTISGGTVYLRNEVRAIFNVTDSVMALTGDLSECGDAEADALVVAVDSLTNSKLLTAISAELICMSTEEIATGKKAYFVGKPNPLMLRHGLRILGCHSADIAFIGDRMDTDIIAGIESNIDTVLVLSGVTAREDIDNFPYRPKYVLDGVGDIVRNKV